MDKEQEKAPAEKPEVDEEERMRRARRFVWTDEDLAAIKIVKKVEVAKNDKSSKPASSEEKDEKTDATSAE